MELLCFEFHDCPLYATLHKLVNINKQLASSPVQFSAEKITQKYRRRVVLRSCGVRRGAIGGREHDRHRGQGGDAGELTQHRASPYLSLLLLDPLPDDTRPNHFLSYIWLNGYYYIKSILYIIS